jgi:hypothetical protein
MEEYGPTVHSGDFGFAECLHGVPHGEIGFAFAMAAGWNRAAWLSMEKITNLEFCHAGWSGKNF